MEGYVTTALYCFVGQSLLQKTERTDVFPSAEHQRRVALVAGFLKSTLGREKMRDEEEGSGKLYEGIDTY